MNDQNGLQGKYDQIFTDEKKNILSFLEINELTIGDCEKTFENVKIELYGLLKNDKRIINHQLCQFSKQINYLLSLNNSYSAYVGREYFYDKYCALKIKDIFYERNILIIIKKIPSILWYMTLYLVSPFRWIIATTLNVFGFSILYYLTNSFVKVELNKYNYFDYLYFSIMAISNPTGDYELSGIGKLLLAIQSLSGYILLAILSALIIKRITRLN